MNPILKISSVLLLMLLIALPASLQAQVELKKTEQNQTQSAGDIKSPDQSKIHGSRFIDKNLDGYRDNAPDSDGDGIPNGSDSDYPGSKNRRGNNGNNRFSDLNGDGINDWKVDSNGDGISDGQQSRYGGKGQKQGNGDGSGKRNMWGPNDGTGNNGVGPQNGTGHGPGGNSGNCNGSGPKRGGR